MRKLRIKKKRSWALNIMMVFSFLFLVVVSVVIHESIHVWQSNFNAREACFFGMNPANASSFSIAGMDKLLCGWVTTSKGTEMRHLIFEDVEADAYFIQTLFLIFSIILVITFKVKIRKRMKGG